MAWTGQITSANLFSIVVILSEKDSAKPHNESYIPAALSNPYIPLIVRHNHVFLHLFVAWSFVLRCPTLKTAFVNAVFCSRWSLLFSARLGLPTEHQSHVFYL